ncbi:hypothetical protein ACS0TY_011985 [Phlomoides rotata]
MYWSYLMNLMTTRLESLAEEKYRQMLVPPNAIEPLLKQIVNQLVHYRSRLEDLFRCEEIFLTLIIS